MKLSRKLVLTLALVLSVAMATTGTLAYLTDRESNVNTFTVGDVDIKLEEEYIEPSQLLPNVKIDKVATISNVGKNPAYVWGTVAVPAELAEVIDITKNEENWDWNSISSYNATIEESLYTVYTALYTGGENGVLHPENATEELMTAVMLDRFVDIAPDGGMHKVVGGTVTDLNWDIDDKSKPVVYVSAYALQSQGVEDGVKGAYELYNDQWGNPANGATGGMGTPENNEFVVQNSDELQDALETIKNNSGYWNKEVFIKLASNTYGGDFVINQYPEWNGVVGAGSSDNNMSVLYGNENVTHIVIEGTGNATFTGNVTMQGFGNAGTGFDKAKASTTFNNVVFDGEHSVEENGKDKIVAYVNAGANNVNFDNCEFKNATHITVGGSGANAVGAVTFNNCAFHDGGCVSGYAETLEFNTPSVSAASKGFVSNQKAGTITVNYGEINCTEYAFRTQNSGINIDVNEAVINVTEDGEGTAALVVFRGSNHTADFDGCTLGYKQQNGGTGTGVITID